MFLGVCFRRLHVKWPVHPKHSLHLISLYISVKRSAWTAVFINIVTTYTAHSHNAKPSTRAHTHTCTQTSSNETEHLRKADCVTLSVHPKGVHSTVWRDRDVCYTVNRRLDVWRKCKWCLCKNLLPRCVACWLWL